MPKSGRAASASETIAMSNLQVFMIALAGITAFGHFVYIHLAIVAAGRDAWVSWLLASLVGLLIIWVHMKVAISPGQSLVLHAKMALGKWMGGFVSILYILFFTLVVAITMRVVTDFLGIIYPNTPSSLFLFSEFGVAAWVIYAGIEVLGRVVQILVPILMLIGVTASILSSPDKDFTQIFPILNASFGEIWNGSLVFIAMFSELVAFAMVTENAAQPSKLPRQSLFFGVIVMLMFLGPITGTVMVFGETLAKDLAYPTYSQIQYMHLGQVVERLDVLGVVLWAIGSFLRIALFLYASVKALAQLTDAKRESTFLIPMVVFSLAVSLSVQHASREEVFYFLSTAYLLIAPCIGIGLPTLTGAIYLIRQKLGPGGKDRQSGEPSKEGKSRGGNGQAKGKRQSTKGRAGAKAVR